MSNTLFADLTSAQAQAAILSGPVLALAGAGTGKTKALTAGIAHRVGSRGIPPSRVLAVTFTNKAAAEMRARVQAGLGEGRGPSWVGTFHGLGARQLRTEPDVAGLRDGFEILDADDSKRIIRRLLQGREHSGAADDFGMLGRDPIKLIANKISGFKDALLTPTEAVHHVEAQIAAPRAAMAVDPHLLRLSARLYADYQRALREANAADFGDLLLWPVLAMRNHPDYRARWAAKFDAVLADEYQDVNLVQYTWLRLLAAEHRELFCVGDDDQSIYGWRGADVRFIRRFTQDFPEAQQVRLEENFRSTGHILHERQHDHLARSRSPRKDPVHQQAARRSNRGGVLPQPGRRGGRHRRRDRPPATRGFAMARHGNPVSDECAFDGRSRRTCCGNASRTFSSVTSDSTKERRSKMLWRSCASQRTRTAASRTRRFAASSTRPLAGLVPRALSDGGERGGVSGMLSFPGSRNGCALPPKARAAGVVFADAIRGTARAGLTLADQLSLLLDATGYRAMLRDSQAEGMEEPLREPARTDRLGRAIPLGARTARSCQPVDQRAARRGRRLREADDAAQEQRSGVPACVSARP